MAAGDTAGAGPRVLRGALIGAGGALLAALLWLPGFLSTFEARTWDLRARAFQAPGAATDQVVTILLDQESLDWAEESMALGWPWPRELIAVMADFCRAAGVKSLAFDVLYTEPSAYGVEDDERFVQSVRDLGRVVGAAHLAMDQGGAVAWPADIAVPGVTLADGGPAVTPRRVTFTRATFPNTDFAGAVRILGNTNLVPDEDKVYRRVAPLSWFAGEVVPALGVATLLAAGDTQPEIRLTPGLLTVGAHRVPLDRDGQAILRYRGPTTTHKAWRAAAVVRSAIQLLNGETPEIDPKELEGKYVLFGYSAPGLLDLRPTPMSGSYPGVEVHATLLDNLLSDDFIRDVPVAVTLALLLVLCAGAGILASVVQGTAPGVLLYVVLLPLGAGLGIGAYPLGLALPILPLVTGTAVTLVAAGLYNYATEGRQRRYLKGAFKQYLSPDVIEELIAHPERLRLGGERRELTIFFSDLQGFTALSEALTPEELTSVLNEYLSAMTDIIQGEGGTIDKYEGDAIIAFWNAPLEQPDHALRGVRAALGCQEKLAQMRPGLKARVGRDLHMRIGMNTGPAVVGNMGSRTRFDYTMLGDAVNLAARLEGVNKQFHTYTMVSAALMGKIGGAYPARELGRIGVVGRREPVVVFEPMTADTAAARRETLAVFSRGLAAYYAGRLAEAELIFREIGEVDPAAGAYAERCRELAAAPIPADWTGVWVMTSK